MSTLKTVVDKLNNRVLIAIIVALFLYGIVRRVAAR
jgi:hypothetical protein